MANFDHNKIGFVSLREERNDALTKHLSSIAEERVPREQDMGFGYCAPDSAKRVKLQENGDSTFLKLKGFFEAVQKQHPESRLELQQVDGNWRVWCGACKKLLRPDKSGKAIHNIQRQHFTSARHSKKLHLMLQAEEEAESRRKTAVGKGSAGRDDGHR